MKTKKLLFCRTLWWIHIWRFKKNLFFKASHKTATCYLWKGKEFCFGLSEVLPKISDIKTGMLQNTAMQVHLKCVWDEGLHYLQSLEDSVCLDQICTNVFPFLDDSMQVWTWISVINLCIWLYTYNKYIYNLHNNW